MLPGAALESGAEMGERVGLRLAGRMANIFDEEYEVRISSLQEVLPLIQIGREFNRDRSSAKSDETFERECESEKRELEIAAGAAERFE